MTWPARTKRCKTIQHARSQNQKWAAGRKSLWTLTMIQRSGFWIPQWSRSNRTETLRRSSCPHELGALTEYDEGNLSVNAFLLLFRSFAQTMSNIFSIEASLQIMQWNRFGFSPLDFRHSITIEYKLPELPPKSPIPNQSYSEVSNRRRLSLAHTWALVFLKAWPSNPQESVGKLLWKW